MSRLVVAVLLALACGAPSSTAVGKACSSDRECGAGNVCSDVAGTTCMPSCEPGDHAFCEAAAGPRYGCYKFVGPDSGGYACQPPHN